MATMNKVFAGYHSRLAKLENVSAANPFARGVAWVQGHLTPLSEARIPLIDQGFLRSDLTYDVAGVWDGRFFRLDDHIERLRQSCAKLRMQLPLPPDQINSILVNMVAKSDIRDAYVCLIVTRGLKSLRGHKPGDTYVNNLYMFVQPFVWVMSPEVQMAGNGHAVVARTVRRISPGSIDPTVKNLQWGDFTRGIFEAADRGAMYPFLTDGDGNLTEGSGFNIVLIKGGTVYTPERGVLEGVTRRTVLEIARAMGMEVRVEHVPVETAYGCDEMFMCTTAGGVMPITNLDGKPVGKDGKVGKVTRAIWDEYWRKHYDEGLSFEVDYAKGTVKKDRAKL
jgi:branched-subunit amino acid aminotransferase/4-amino-4-deoxychorismate lyase